MCYKSWWRPMRKALKNKTDMTAVVLLSAKTSQTFSIYSTGREPESAQRDLISAEGHRTIFKIFRLYSNPNIISTLIEEYSICLCIWLRGHHFVIILDIYSLGKCVLGQRKKRNICISRGTICLFLAKAKKTRLVPEVLLPSWSEC